MPMKQETHIIRGMQRDLTVSKFSPEFAYENMNIRITARENNTLMAVTNEKGNAALTLYNESDQTTEVSLDGLPLGYCVLKDYITLFTKGDTDNIYRIQRQGDKYLVKTLFSGDLNFDIEYPIQTLGSFENENIQKVYWVDGINQARAINIAALTAYTDSTQFNFARDITANETITVTKNPDGSGVFHSGVIQYAISYYVKNAQESAIIYTSPLMYITPKGRGGSPEEMCNCSFNIQIANADKNFDGINIYSIQRTSLDATPSVKLLNSLPIVEGLELIITKGPFNVGGADINYTNESSVKIYRNNEFHELSEYAYDTDSDGNKIYTFDFLDSEGIVNLDDIEGKGEAILYRAGNVELKIGPTKGGISPIQGSTLLQLWDIIISDTEIIAYVDGGTGGSTVDPTELLYKGGEEIVPYTIAQKDNTLFLGNLTIKRNSIPKTIREDIARLDVTSDNKETSVSIDDTSLSIYRYKGYLDYDSDDATTFKKGEEYRLGLIALHQTGKWSEAIPIGDYTMDSNVTVNSDGTYNLTEFRCSIYQQLLQDLRNLGYIAIKPVVCFPSYSDRNVVAQGILCPTVYISSSRNDNSPYAISSWFARFKAVNADTSFNSDLPSGSVPEFRHGFEFGATARRDRPAEVPFSVGGVDENIVTFHSPDIQFDDNIKDYIPNSKLRIVGYAVANANAIDYSVLGDSTFRTVQTVNWSYDPVSYDYSHLFSVSNRLAHRRLITAGLWRDGVVAEEHAGQGDVDDSINLRNNNTLYAIYGVYPWNRNTLNNDWRGSAGTANLIKKSMSTLTYTDTTYFSNGYYNFEEKNNPDRMGISKVTLFNSNEVTIERLPVPEYVLDTESKIYQGNYSGVFTPTEAYRARTVYRNYVENGGSPTSIFYDNYYAATNNALDTLPEKLRVNPGILVGFGGYTRSFNDSCEVKYKSSPHAVITLNGTQLYSTKLLPSASIYDTIPTTVTIDVSKLPQPKETITLKAIGSGGGSNPTIGDYWFDNTDWGGFEGMLRRCISTNPMVWEVVTDPLVGTDAIYKYNTTEYYMTRKANSYQWILTDRTQIPVYSKDDLRSWLDVTGEAGILWLAELYREGISNKFGGTTDSAYSSNSWLPAGKTISILNEDSTILIHFTQGDTYYQRFDCLKTYPFDTEAKNNIVEIVSFMCETRVNIDGRYDRNRGQKNNMSMTPQNFNLFNPVYSQKDNFFTYNYLSLDDAAVSRFPNTVTWTSEKVSGALTDAWTNITLASTLDLDGDKGEVTSLNTFNNGIFCFQEQGLSNIIFNSRVQIPTSDNTPIEISNNYKVDGKRYISNIVGCLNKWSICETVNGIYFIDNLTNALYRFDGSQLTPLSDQLGFRQFIGDNNSIARWNPKDYNNFRTFYDKTNDDVYFINDRYCLCYSELLQQFTSFMSYERTPMMFNFEDKLFSINKNKMWEQGAGKYNYFFGDFKPYYVTIIANQDEPFDKTYNTVEYRATSYTDSTFNAESTFSDLEVWNEYQYGKEALSFKRGVPSTLKRKFRIWRANIPRDRGNRNRIRNTWAYVKLSSNNVNEDSMQLYDIAVNYFV